MPTYEGEHEEEPALQQSHRQLNCGVAVDTHSAEI